MRLWFAALPFAAAEHVGSKYAVYMILELAALPPVFLSPPDSKTVKGPVVEQLPKILERCSQIGNVVLICIGNLRAAYCCSPKNRFRYYLAEYYAALWLHGRQAQ